MPVEPNYCDICRRYFISQIALDQHNRTTTAHPHAADSTIVPLRCTLCSAFCPGYAQYEKHVLKPRHQKALRANSNFDPGPEELDPYPDHEMCTLCQTFVPVLTWDIHLSGRRHRILQRCRPLQEKLDETEPNKKGISISEDTIQFGILPSTIDNDLQKKVRVTNSDYKSVILLGARLSSGSSGIRFV